MKKTITKEQLNVLCEIIENDSTYVLQKREPSYSVYVNRFGSKKLVTETLVASLGFREYVKRLIPKALELITRQSFIAQIDIFCSSVISQELIDSVSRDILRSEGIQLTVFDFTAISTYKADPVKEYLGKIWGTEDLSEQKYDGTQKALFDILVSGKDSLDIKTKLLYSVVVISIYKNGNHVVIDQLKRIVCDQLGKDVSNFDVILHQMAQQDIIKFDKATRSHVSLKDSTYESVIQIVKKAQIMESEFMSNFSAILAKHNVSNETGIFKKLVMLYQHHFATDSTEEFEKRADKAYKELENLIKSQIEDSNEIKEVIKDIKELCEENRYLDSISATSSFLGMYRSDKLNDFINNKQKCVILDTPLLVYLLCYNSMALLPAVDWQQPQYKATRELYKLQSKRPGDVLLYTMDDYLNEVVGEYKKALQMGWLEPYLSIDFLKSANNTFYNYYRFLMDNPELYDDSNKIHCFDDFAKEVLAFNNVCIDSVSFNNDAYRDIHRHIVLNYSLRLAHFLPNSIKVIKKITKDYQSTLKYSKSPIACEADAKALVFLSKIQKLDGASPSRDVELYISTWDRTFDKFRKKLFKEGSPNRFFITTPAKLINKVALANFNIDDSCISNDVFLFADANFDIQEKVVKFVNKAAPIFGAKHTTNKFFNAVYDWYQEQVENDTINEEKETDTYTYKESFVLKLFDKIMSLLSPDQIEKLTSDVTIDNRVGEIFNKFKKDYTSDDEVEKSTSEMVSQMKLLIDSGYEPPTEPVIE